MQNFEQARPLLDLNKEVLQEVVREGEMRLQAQLSVAIAADQRALTIIGFQTTTVTASVAAATALALSSKPIAFLTIIGFLFGCSLLVAAFIALSAVRPKLFTYPGNKPECWMPHRWLRPISEVGSRSLTSARVEQCFCLNRAIEANQSDLEKAGKRVRISLDISLWTMVAAALAIAGYGTFVVFG